MRTPEKISAIFTASDRLTQLSRDAAHLATLNKLLQSHLPTALSGHIRLAAIRDEVMVLQADSSAWASQLRFRTPEILARVAELPNFPKIVSIRVRTRNDHSPATASPRSERKPSGQAKNQLLRQAEVTDDPELRRALRRLAANPKFADDT